jgi:hypothetical protein
MFPYVDEKTWITQKEKRTTLKSQSSHREWRETGKANGKNPE